MARRNNGPRLKQGDNGTWYIHWTDNGRSKRVSTRTGDRAEAEQVLAGWLQVKNRPTTPSRDVTVAECLREYVENHVLPKTVDAKRLAARCERLAGYFTMRVNELDDSDFLNYAEARRAGSLRDENGKPLKPAKDSTIRHDLAHVGAALRHCARRKIITPADVPYIPSPPAGEPRPYWLNETQVDALLNFLNDEDRCRRMSIEHRLVVLALATGARRRSIELLTWPLVDRDAKLIRYDLQVKRQTKKRKVAVPIADWLEPYLDRMEREAESGYVLDRPIDTSHRIENLMRRVFEATGDPAYKHVTAHVFRHTLATLMLRNNATMWQVAGVLGDRVEMIDRIYGHHSQDHLRDATNVWRRPV